MTYDWSFSTVWGYWYLFVGALGMTLWLSFLTIVVTIPLGLVIVVIRTSRFRAANLVVRLIIELVRSIPPLVLVVWVYYCLPILLNLNLSAVQSVVIALSLYSSVFFAEIFRSGIQSVEPGFLEAAQSSGMTRLRTFQRITAPLAFRATFPAFISQCVLVLKSTSLASSVAVPELLYMGQRISIEVFRPMETLTTIAFLYIIMIMPLSYLANTLERKWKRQFSRVD